MSPANKVFKCICFLLSAVLFSFCNERPPASTVSVVDRPPALTVSVVDRPPQENIVAFYEGHDTGGNTSIAYDAEDIYKWSGNSSYAAEDFGYYNADGQEVPYIKRDRDLGQTFTYTGTKPKRLTGITVATGYGTNVVRKNTYGKKMSIQLFEVTGSPVLHRNESDSTMEAFHGFPHNRPGDNIPHERDDYFTGENYTGIGVFTGAVFPDKIAFGFPGGEKTDIDPNHANLKGKYLQFKLPAASRIVLQPGKTYAFLIMLDQMGKDFGFTLANHYYGTYPGGHGIRRDGDGVFPPVPPDPSKNFTDPANRKAHESAHFPADLQKRTAIPPGTDGYPDVDTWRDLQFYIEAE